MRKLLLLFITVSIFTGCKKENENIVELAHVQYQIELYDDISSRPASVSSDGSYVKICYKVNDGSLKTVIYNGKNCNKISLKEEFDLGKDKEVYLLIQSNLEGTGIRFDSKILQSNQVGGTTKILSSNSSNNAYQLQATIR